MLGIDVAKDMLACTLLDPHTRKALWRRSLPNTPSGIDTLLSATPADAPWVLEPTGRYSTPVAQRARQAQRSVLLAPPRQAKSFLRSIQCRAKTDKLDSEGLALFALSQPLAPYPLKTKMQEQTDQLLLARRSLSRAAAGLGQQVQELPHAKEPLQKALAEIKAQVKALDAQIAALTGQPEMAAAARLRQVPGIGPVTAAALASRLAGKQFSHPDKLVAYLGLDIGVSQSGRREGEPGRASPEGRAGPDQAGRRGTAAAAVPVCVGEPAGHGQPVQSAVRAGAGQGPPDDGGAVCGGAQDGEGVLVHRRARQ